MIIAETHHEFEIQTYQTTDSSSRKGSYGTSSVALQPQSYIVLMEAILGPRQSPGKR